MAKATRPGHPSTTATTPATTTAAARTPAPTPEPGISLIVSIYRWPRGQSIHRVHRDAFGAAQFNPGVAGNARFSPIVDATGQPIPTLYGGSSFACAAMETVFHDVPFAPGLKTVDKRQLDGHAYSVVRPRTDLQLADLSHIALRKLGISRSQLIDTEKNCYPQTQLWAQAIHAQFPAIQGLCWVSRQDDTARALMLFGDRLQPDTLEPYGQSQSLIATDHSSGDGGDKEATAAYVHLLALAERIGVLVVTR